MMNLKIFAENPGKLNIFNFVIKDLKKFKEDTVFVFRLKTLMLNVFQKRNLFTDDKCWIQIKVENIWKK